MNATIPALKGFETYYGLQLSDIGEDGNVVILGHHSDKPLRVVAALNRHARTFWGLVNLMDNTGAELDDLACSLAETYAVVIERCDDADDTDHALDCLRCREIVTADWYIEWNHKADDKGAFPVTMWRA
jgi:hypothetical protein